MKTTDTLEPKALDLSTCLKLWRAHGGSTFGPRVEHVSMKEADFLGFCRTLSTASIPQAAGRENLATLLRQLKHCADKPMRNLETFPAVCRQAHDELAALAVPAPERQVAVKPLVWREYPSLVHDYGSGFWEANGVGNVVYTILDVGPDLKNGARYYLRGMSQSDTLDEAKALAQADYEQRILSALTHPLASHEGDDPNLVLVPREPTEAMLEAGVSEMNDHLGAGSVIVRDAVFFWRAMIQAAQPVEGGTK